MELQQFSEIAYELVPSDNPTIQEVDEILGEL